MIPSLILNIQHPSTYLFYSYFTPNFLLKIFLRLISYKILKNNHRRAPMLENINKSTLIYPTNLNRNGL